MRSLALIASLFLISAVHGYVYTCLDRCECDTDDEIIHCHNSDRTELKVPEGGQRLRGFPVIGLTYNNLVSLPEEDVLLAKFPDLKVVDVERNPSFDCDTIKNYDTVKIISDCFRNISEIARVPRLYRPTRDCDVACQAQKHYDKLHEYVLNLWEILKEKYNNFDYDKTLNQIQEFFKDVVTKINKLGRDIHTTIDKHPKDISPAVNDREITVA